MIAATTKTKRGPKRATKRKTPLNALLDLLSGSGASVIRSTFAAIDIAEEELKAAKLPKADDRALFSALIPTELLRGKSAELYRAHVRELIGRTRKRQSLEEATDAELLCVMLWTAGSAPLTRAGQLIAEHLFERVFPDKAKELLADGRERQSWPRQLEDELRVARKKYAQTHRALNMQEAA